MASRTASRRLPALPLLVLLIALAGGAMLVPAGFALATGEGWLAALFGKAALITLAGAAVLGAATAGFRPADPVRSLFLSLIGAYAVLPPLMALPLAEAVPDLGFRGAWFEMVSSFTTTGASLLPPMPETPAAVHLWNALVGWLGGFFVLLAASALLAPLNLGGLEVGNPRPVGKSAFAATPIHAAAEPGARLAAQFRLLAPVYGALTLALWVGLLMAGEAGLPALAHAMGILSTSGISPVGGLEGGQTGRIGEALMLVFLVFALTRRALPGTARADAATGRRRRLRDDEELRLAAVVVVGLAVVFAVRAVAAQAGGVWTQLDAAQAGFWAGLFTAASFLSTTGYVSADWSEGAAAALRGAGLGAPVLILGGLVMMGGGVATTAGGIKLLRIHALWRHGRHEMEKLLHPSVVAGGGERKRHLRTDGAYLAWLAFMLFVLSLAVVTGALSLAGLGFEAALVLAIAGLSTTGPLAGMAGIAGEPGLAWLGLDDGARAILAGAMVLGRLELLAIVALLVPESWRR